VLEQLTPDFRGSRLLSAQGWRANLSSSSATSMPSRRWPGLFQTDPRRSLAAYFKYRSTCLPPPPADVLPGCLRCERFDFYRHTLNGQPEQRERWSGRVCLNGALGEAIDSCTCSSISQPLPSRRCWRWSKTSARLFASHRTACPGCRRTRKRVALEKLAVIPHQDRLSGPVARLLRSAGACRRCFRQFSPVTDVFEWHGSWRVSPNQPTAVSGA